MIITIAGNGTLTSAGDGGTATTSHTANPGFGSFDASGNYYFGEGLASTGPKIRKINNSGNISTVVGTSISGFFGDTGPATAAKIAYPICISDSAGNLYVVDYYNYRIRKVNAATGIINTIAGTGAPTSTGNGGPATAATMVPIFVCVDKASNIFVSDQGPVGGPGSIRRIDATSGIITFVASAVAQGMCFNSTGKLILGAGARIIKLDTATGVLDTIAGTGLTGPFNGDGIAADTANFEVYDIALDRFDNIYISDEGNHRIRKIVASSNIIYTIAGTGISGFSGDLGPATNAKLYDPSGVAIDSCGNVYLADLGNNRIRKIIIDTPCYGHNNPALSINSVQNLSEISIYPNPATDFLHVEDAISQTTYRIMNVYGKLMSNGTLNTGDNSIPIGILPPGLYVIALTTNEEITIKKIVKQ